jgi:nitrate reductase gamma subunit
MEFLGSIGIGLVCGWLAGMFNFRQQVFKQLLVVLAAAGLVMLEVILLAGWKAGLATLCSGLVALFIHRIWRSELRQRQ